MKSHHKKEFTFQTRREYHIAQVAGVSIVLLLFAVCLYFSFDDNQFNFLSLSFWAAVLLFLFFPFGLISLLSSMASVRVSQDKLVIAYRFKSHRNVINFSEVVEVHSQKNLKRNRSRSSSQDSFTLTLSDGRMFDFSRSQFKDYKKLKEMCEMAVSKKKAHGK